MKTEEKSQYIAFMYEAMETSDKTLKCKLRQKMRLVKLRSSFISDAWGNLVDCYWNEMIKEEILKIESL